MIVVFQARFLVPVQETNQSRRVVVSHNVDKALKEGNGRFSRVFYDYHMSMIMQMHLETVYMQERSALQVSDHWIKVSCGH